ncbi:MAG: hypothetical protein ABSA93_25385 [Streptosporangiaceae bacterium]
MRHMLTGYGPTARQRRRTRVGGFTASAGQMKARADAIDDLLAETAVTRSAAGDED